MSILNPDNNPVLQALLDCRESKLGSLPINEVIKLLSEDKALADDLGGRFAARSYNQDNVEYTQLTIDQRIVTALSDAELKILVFMGMYAAQNGLISIKQQTLHDLLGMSPKSIQRAFKGLEEVGAISRIADPARHSAPVWQVNPDILHSGKRQNLKKEIRDYQRLKSIRDIGDQYLFRQDINMQVRQTQVTRPLANGKKIRYMEVDLVPANEKVPQDTATASRGTNKSTINDTNKNTTGGQADQLPGQMSIFLGDPLDDGNLPF